MPPVKHLVLFKFKPDVTAAAENEIWRLLEQLPQQISGIVDFSGGENTSQEGFSKGFTHSFVMTFSDAAARDAYIVDPIHVAVAQKLVPLLDDLVVCDHVVVG